MSDLHSIQWPVLRFGEPNCTVLMYASDQPFTCASTAALRGLQTMWEYFLIDSDLKRFDLKCPRFAAKQSWIQKTVGAFSGKRFPIVWDVSGPHEVSLDFVKRSIAENWERYPSVWQGYDLNEMRPKLEGAQSIKEIFSVFGHRG